jgi:hypothetical protein
MNDSTEERLLSTEKREDRRVINASDVREQKVTWWDSSKEKSGLLLLGLRAKTQNIIM